MGVTPPSACPWLDHPVSGLVPRTSSPDLIRGSRPVQTRFRFASTYRLKLARDTNSLTHYARGTQSHHRGGAPTDCRHPVSGSVSLPSSGFFSPFPHGTGSLSVSKEYLAFGGGPPIFEQDFTCPALLDTSHRASRTGLSPAMACFSKQFRSLSRLGWSPFARRY